jgi:hypothetical protein
LLFDYYSRESFQEKGEERGAIPNEKRGESAAKFIYSTTTTTTT